jgi:16S rRNA C967 or C1407 C5-methylase (RsmB/RsmF family)
MQKECVVCGTQFPEKGKKIFCAKKCGTKYWRLTNLERHKEIDKKSRLKNLDKRRANNKAWKKRKQSEWGMAEWRAYCRSHSRGYCENRRIKRALASYGKVKKKVKNLNHQWRERLWPRFKTTKVERDWLNTSTNIQK